MKHSILVYCHRAMDVLVLSILLLSFLWVVLIFEVKKFIFLGSQKEHVRATISQKGLVNFF